MTQEGRDAAPKGREVVALVGMRGAGKTTVGAALARRLGVEFVDCDSRIEEKHRISVREIFERFGEERFRDWERDVLVEVLAEAPGVMATGGGVVMRPANVEDLRRTATVVYLHATPATLARRISGDPSTGARRPSLRGGPPAEELEGILREREPLYRKAAHLVVDAEARAANEIAEEIEAWIVSH